MEQSTVADVRIDAATLAHQVHGLVTELRYFRGQHPHLGDDPRYSEACESADSLLDALGALADDREMTVRTRAAVQFMAVLGIDDDDPVPYRGVKLAKTPESE